jgi:hypothetical protein
LIPKLKSTYLQYLPFSYLPIDQALTLITSLIKDDAKNYEIVEQIIQNQPIKYKITSMKKIKALSKIRLIQFIKPKFDFYIEDFKDKMINSNKNLYIISIL